MKRLLRFFGLAIFLLSAAGCVDDYADILRDQATVDNEVADAIMLVHDEASAKMIASRATGLKEKRTAVKDRKESLSKRLQAEKKTLEKSIPEEVFLFMDERAKNAEKRCKEKLQDLRRLIPTLPKDSIPLAEKVLSLLT